MFTLPLSTDSGNARLCAALVPRLPAAAQPLTMCVHPTNALGQPPAPPPCSYGEIGEAEQEALYGDGAEPGWGYVEHPRGAE